MERDYIRPDKTAKKCMRISCALCLGIIMITATLIVLLALNAGITGNILLVAGWILSAAYIIFAPAVRYERYRYLIDSEAIRVREGLFWISENIVPIERLHKIEVSQGPVAGMFNLSTVCVTTAGGDVNIKFLGEEKAKEIAESLKTKINRIASEGRTGRTDG